MKSILLITAFCISSLLSAQDILGTWHGNLDLGVMTMRVSLHITKTETGFSSTLDSPDQELYGFQMTSTTFENGRLVIISDPMKVKISSEFKNDTLESNFTQGGASYLLLMTRNEVAKVELKRPQEPTPKFDYNITDVTFENKAARVTLSGTLTTPNIKGKHPVAILISGSGPQDRNVEILGHKPFWVIADYLSENGIAVLRYDDRGFGKSSGDFNNSTSKDFASDVEAAIGFLKTQKNIDTKKIGLIGHSEGGLIAPMVASKSKNNVGFVIMLAGPGIMGKDILLLQQELIALANGESEKDVNDTKAWSISVFDFMEKNLNTPNFESELKSHISKLNSLLEIELPEGMTMEELTNSQYANISTKWMKYFLFYNPKNALEMVKCPILALNGTKDLQVPVKENLDAIKKYTAHNKQVKIMEMPDLNHLFQHSETGSPNEYSKIEETFSPEVLVMMKDWIKGLK